MVKTQKIRSEIDDKYKWDLSLIYPSDEAWYEVFNKVSKEIDVFVKTQDTLFDNANSFYKVLTGSLDIERKLNKLYYYACLNSDSNTLDEKYKTMLDEIRNLENKYSVQTVSLVPEILKHEYKDVEKFMKEEKRLLTYERMLREIFRYKPYTLSEKEERLIAEFSKTFSAPNEIYKALLYSDLKFGNILNENKEEVELTPSNYSIFLESKDRSVRKAAFQECYRVYKAHVNTIAEALKSDVDVMIKLSKIKGYSSALEASLFNDEVPVSVHKTLIDTINKNLKPLYEYYEFKKDVLKLDKLHLYDVYAPIASSYNNTYTFEEAKKIVLDVIKIFGNEYEKVANRAFDERWIDIYNNKGKRTGAYSSGGYDTAPYLLLNYEGSFDDVSTLIHELGHSMHTYFSVKNNKYHEYDYKIFVAEVASTVNELLLSYYMYQKSESKEEKIDILNRRLELFKGTIYRQTMFAEFEKAIYDYAENEHSLTSEVFENKYYELVKKYFGPNVYIDNEIRYEWARIPHFYYNFYVYKYATGLSAACKIVSDIKGGVKDAKENYLSFLKTGGTMSPIEELKVAGVDMESPVVVESAIKMFEETFKELKNIYNS